MRKQLFALMLLLVPSCYAVAPFLELRDLRTNYWFSYEQRVLPSMLRALLMAADVARDCDKKKSPINQAHRLAKLLHSHTSSIPAHFVAHEYAPQTYQQLGAMSKRLGIETPLLFIAHDGHDANLAYTCKLAGGYHAVVFGEKFLQKCTTRQATAVMAHELAHIARKHCHKENIARRVWIGVVLSACAGYAGYLGVKSAQDGSMEPYTKAFKKHGPSWLKWLGLLGVSWGITEIIRAALSRKYEREADHYALTAFDGDVEEYISCLQKVYRDSKELRKQERADLESHFLYVENKIKNMKSAGVARPIVAFLLRRLHQYEDRRRNQMGDAKPSVLTDLFSTHPSLDERIAAVRAFDETRQGDD